MEIFKLIEDAWYVYSQSRSILIRSEFQYFAI